MHDTGAALTIHATCVAFQDKGVLITGKSGTGKSALALQLMAFGAQLVADDRTDVRVEGQYLRAQAPAPIAGLIEARGMGLLQADARASVDLSLIIDMNRIETARLPKACTMTLLGIDMPCLYKIDAPYFPAAVLQYLKAGIREA